MKTTDSRKPIERLKEFISMKGLSDSAFEKKAGLSNGYITNSTKGTGGLNSETIMKLYSVFPEINLMWIITGDEAFKEGRQENFSVNAIRKLKSDRTKQIQSIPLYNMAASAGIFELIAEEHRGKKIPLEYIQIPNMPVCDGAVPITGDSMYPLLKNGDIVLFKEVHDKNNIIWGEMYLAAVKHNGDSFFFSKYIQRSEREGYARFVSENKHHQPVEFPIDSIQGIALIKATIRFHSSF